MKALDLFCGAGGASMGLKQAGFKTVIGIDIVEQPEYVFGHKAFIQDNVFNYHPEAFHEYNFIWASPPCQNYSWGTAKWRNKGKKYLDLVGKTRKLLLKTGKPFVIENVVGAPLRRDLMLCGEMFDLRLIRHRIFECHGFKPVQIPHKKHRRAVWNETAIGVWSGGKPGCFGNEEKRKYYVTVAGHGGNGGKGNTTLKAWQEAMQIDWITKKDTLKECVPPKYSEYLAKQFLNGGDK